jgi:poly-beta-1,6-N-acetyl-D-glucosamine synthase
MMGFQEIYTAILLLITAVYGWLIGAFTIGLIRIRKQPKPDRKSPSGFVSVIIPVRNEAGQILRILEEMRGQDFAASSMEIIVTDDSSEDGTLDLVRSFAYNHPDLSVTLLSSMPDGPDISGKKMAIERAVAKARGEILLFTDADTTRGPDWISSMVSCFKSSEIQMVLGPVCFPDGGNLLQKIQTLEFLGLMGTTAGSARLGFPVMCNGANLAYRRDAFLQTGGFRENLKYRSGDDQFMMSSIKKRFGRTSLVFNFDPSSVVGTEPEATLNGFINQRIRWVSKSRGYRDPAVIFAGAITFLAHFMLLGGMLSGLFIPEVLIVSVLLWVAKISIEYPMVFIMSRFFGKRILVGYYVAAQAFQLIYVPTAGLLGLFLPYRWKGRKG